MNVHAPFMELLSVGTRLVCARAGGEITSANIKLYIMRILFPQIENQEDGFG
jgi:hypothetical protein